MSVNDQTWTLYRGEDRSIVLTGVDETNPTGWTMSATISVTPGGTPVLSITSLVVNGTGPYTIEIPLTRAQTRLLSASNYALDVWRTDSGSAERLAGGKLFVATPVYPI